MRTDQFLSQIVRKDDVGLSALNKKRRVREPAKRGREVAAEAPASGDEVKRSRHGPSGARSCQVRTLLKKG